MEEQFGSYVHVKESYGSSKTVSSILIPVPQCFNFIFRVIAQVQIKLALLPGIIWNLKFNLDILFIFCLSMNFDF